MPNTLTAGLLDELGYINGLNSDGTLRATSFATWSNGSNPATYNSTSYAHKWSSDWQGSAAGSAAGSYTNGTGSLLYYFNPDSSWSALEQSCFVASFDMWSAVCNVSFALATNASDANFTITRAADAGDLGRAYCATSIYSSATAGIVGGTLLKTNASSSIVIDTNTPGFGIDGTFTTCGGYFWDTIIHELGHSLGLGHGGPYNGAVNEATQQYSAYDTRLWSLMSYINPVTTTSKYYGDYSVTGTNWGYSEDHYQRNPTTWMPLDILAIQQLYGAPTSTPLSGGQTFGFNCSIAGDIAQFFDFTKNVDPVVTLWDQGTGNTLDLSGWNTASIVNLNPGTFSSCDGMTNNIGIAFNTAIDSLVLGAGNDTVTCNDNGNTVYGDAGNDTIWGGTGNDTLEGGAGDDVLNGGDGSDTVSYAHATGGVTVDLAIVTAQNIGGGQGLDTLSSIENLIGSAFNDTLFGDNGDNVLTGGDGNDSIVGRGGNDTIDGGAGDDVLYGSAGDDVIIGGSGFDTFNQNSDTAGFTVDLAAGTATGTGIGSDTLSGIEKVLGGFGNDILSGSSGNDFLYGNGGTNVLSGGDGDDGLFDTGVASTIDGGAGSDSLYLDRSGFTAAVSFVFNSGDSSDITLADGTKFRNIEKLAILTGSGDDSITFNAPISTNSWFAGGGNDTATVDLSSFTGYVYAGDTGDNYAVYAAGNLVVNLINVENFHITAGSGDDLLDSKFGDDWLTGGAGVDTVRYSNASGAVTVSLAVAGPQVVGGGMGTDTLSGIENIIGGSYNDTLTGDANDNTITGGYGDDTINGGAGTDTAVFGNNSTAYTITQNGYGVYTVSGPWGTDALTNVERVKFDNTTITLDLVAPTLSGSTPADNAASVAVGANIVLTFTENVTAGSGNIVIHKSSDGSSVATIAATDPQVTFSGNTATINPASNLAGLTGYYVTVDNGAIKDIAGNFYTGISSPTALNFVTASTVNVINGDDGNNVLNGTAGDDAIYGFGGNDTLRGGAGDDLLDGGDGTDTASYTDATGGVTVSLAVATAQAVGGGLGSDTLTNIENLTGSAYNDTLTGDGGDNVLDGGAGNDTISGGGGNDTIYAGAGTVVLNGGAGNDTFYLGGNLDAADQIDGSSGSDTVVLNGDYSGTALWLTPPTLRNIENIVLSGGHSYNFNLADLTWPPTGPLTIDTSGLATGNSATFNATATTGALVYTGGVGDDHLSAGSGNVTASMGAGNDTVWVNGSGIATLDGGAGGSDWLGITCLSSANVNLTINPGSDTVVSLPDGSTFSNFELINLTTGSGNDTVTFNNPMVTGGTVATIWDGGNGNDTVTVNLANVTGAITATYDVATTKFDVVEPFSNFTGYLFESIHVENINITAGAYADSIITNAGNDTISGGGGNDTLDGGTGTNTISGGNGNDTIRDWGNGANFSSGTGSTIDGGAGEDSLLLYRGDVTSTVNMTFTPGSSTPTTLADGTSIRNVEHLWLVTGSGNDSVTYNGVQFSAVPSVDHWDAGAGNDALTLNLSSYTTPLTLNNITNGAGDVFTNGIAFFGFTGVESFNITGGTGNDNLITSGGNDTISGGDGDDYIDGGSGNNVLNGGNGDDTILSGSGNDTISGGSGTDAVSYGAATSGVTVSLAITTAQAVGGGMGNDTLSGIENIWGSGYNDVLTGDAGNNVLYGGNGDDTFVGDAGDDTFNGGSGKNTVTYQNASGGVTVYLSLTTAQAVGGGQGSDTLLGIQNLIGSAYADTLTGDSGNNTLTGGAGNDTLGGGAGNNVLNGGEGDDALLDSGSGSTIDGGAGNDKLTLSRVGLTAPFTMTFTPGSATAETASDGTAITGIEVLELTTGSGDDTVTFNHPQYNSYWGASIWYGGDGADTAVVDFSGSSAPIYARQVQFGGVTGLRISQNPDLPNANTGQLLVEFHDVENFNITGGTSDDTLSGSTGNDIIDGGAGNDTIDGKAGTDTIIGGTGNDSLSASGTNSQIFGGDGNDTLSTYDNAVNAVLKGGAGDDLFITGSGDTGGTLLGEDGNDTINDHGANSVISGGTGDDTIYAAGANPTIDGGAGNDVLHLDRGSATAAFSAVFTTGSSTPTTFSDGSIISNVEHLFLTTGAGNDSLTIHNPTSNSGAYGNYWDAGAGVDTAVIDLSAATSDILAVWASGNSWGQVLGGDAILFNFIDVERLNLTSGSGNDILNGGDYDDTLAAGAGNDTINGNGGNDTIYAGPGDTVDGGAGTDTAYIDLSVLNAGLTSPNTWWYTHFSPTSVDLYTGVNGNPTPTHTQSIALSNVENFVLVGTSSDDIWTLGYGNYTISSGGFAGNEDVGPDWIDCPATGGVTIDLALRTPQAIGGGYGTLTLQDNFTQVWGTPYNDTLYGNSLNNTLLSFGGNDLLDGRTGTDTADYGNMGAGVTVDLRLQNTAQVVDAAGDTNTLVSIENLTGSAYGDTLTGDANANVLKGGAGNDTIDGGGGADTIYGGDGDDRILNSWNGNDTVYGDAGFDTVVFQGARISANTVIGWNEANPSTSLTIRNTALNFTTSVQNVEALEFTDGTIGIVLGGPGDDVLTATMPSLVNYIIGGTGNDTITGGNAADNLYGGTGNNTIYGLDGNDYIYCGSGNGSNTLFGGAGDDMIFGGSGNDILNGGTGNDILNGGSGYDTASYADATNGVTVTLAAATAQAVGGGQGSDTLSNIENLLGSNYNDTLTGSDGYNVLTGGAGDDTLIGGVGDDTLNGGGGLDKAVYSGNRASYTITLNSNESATVSGADGTDTLTHVEQLVFADQTVAIGTAPTSDFNGDGTGDLVWQNSSGQAGIWLLNGTAVLSNPIVGTNPGASWHVKGSGDFDGDGMADILWQNDSGQARIWFMNGTSILNATDIGPNPGPSWHIIGAGDFNGDGKADILWQNADGTPAIWLMNGTTLVSGLALSTNPGSDWRVVGAGDFDGDGKADILWQNQSGQAALWFMNGTTILSGPQVWPNPGKSWRIIGTGDFNGDGKADILWQNDSGQAAIWLMDGANYLTATSVGSNPGIDWKVVGAADVNGDGKSDILWQNDSGQAGVWLMNGTTATSQLTVGSNPGSDWRVANNGILSTTIPDPVSDLVVTNLTYGLMNGLPAASVAYPNASVSFNFYSGNLGTAEAPASTVGLYLSVDSTISPDSDLLLTSVGSIAPMAANTPTASNTWVGFSLPANLTPGTYYVGAYADYGHAIAESNENNNASNVIQIQVERQKSDFNGDGYADVLWQNDSGQAGIWLLNGTTILSAPNVGSNPGPSWHVIGSGDFNGDGKADILWQSTNGQAGIWLMNGTTVLSDPAVGPNPGTSWKVIGAGDFDGDGKSDILWQSTSGQAGIWFMNGANVLSAVNTGANPGPAWHVIGTGDFNGDGKADILWQSTNGQAGIWLMNGNTVLSDPAVGPNPGASWKVVGAGDFDGDGKSDILWQNTSGQAGIWFMNGTNVLSAVNTGANPGSDWKVKGAADVNGDGKADILWQNTNGQARVWLMSGNTILSQPTLGANPGSSWHVIAGTGG